MVISLLRPLAGVLSIERKLMAAKRKARPQAPHAIVSMAALDINLPSSPRMINPSKGRSNTHRLRLTIRLASQYIHVVNVNIAARAKNRDDQSQANHNFGSRDGQHNEHKHLPVCRIEKAGKCHK